MCTFYSAHELTIGNPYFDDVTKKPVRLLEIINNTILKVQDLKDGQPFLVNITRLHPRKL